MNILLNIINICKKNILLVVFLILPIVTFSHPHVFVSNRITAVFDNNGLSGLTVFWEFDEFFTNMIAVDYDENENGKLDKSEIEIIRKDAFSNLVNYNYFTNIRIDGKIFKVVLTSDFIAEIKKNKLIYRFFIPSPVKSLDSFKEVRISQIDKSYYTDIAFFEKKPFLIKSNSGFEIKYSIEENKKESYYSDMLHPVEIILKFRNKK